MRRGVEPLLLVPYGTRETQLGSPVDLVLLTYHATLPRLLIINKASLSHATCTNRVVHLLPTSTP